MCIAEEKDWIKTEETRRQKKLLDSKEPDVGEKRYYILEIDCSLIFRNFQKGRNKNSYLRMYECMFCQHRNRKKQINLIPKFQLQGTIDT